MRKEILLNKKKTEIKDMVWYLREAITEEEMKQFSISQLNLICKIAVKAEAMRESKDPFFSLSATEVIHKDSGRIASFSDNGLLEENETDVLNSAAASVYKNIYKNLKKG